MSGLSETTKTYIQNHQLEEQITNAVNQVLQEQPSDPFSLLQNIFSQRAQNQVELVDYQAIQVLSNEGLPQIKYIIHVRFHTQLKQIHSCVTSNTPSQEIGIIYTYDEEPQQFAGKGMKKIQEISKILKPSLIGLDISNQVEVDKVLQFYLKENKNQANIVTPLSFSFPYVVSQLQNMQYYQYLREQLKSTPSTRFPKLFINLLQGSKLVGLKSKIYRLMLIVNEQEDLNLAVQIITTVTANLRKTIVSGKLGEAALKFYTDGTFLTTVDTIPDNLKIVEDAINSSPYKAKCAIGIVWQADLFYNPDKKNYELDNPKQLFDADQLIEYYYKLSEDRPLIQYMEDPIWSGDTKGWQKLLTKFKSGKVMIGSRKVITSVEQATANYIKLTFPNNQELTQQQVDEFNQNQLNIPCVFLRPNELGTFTNFQQIAQILQSNNTNIIISGQLSETLDTTLIDIAFALPNAILNINAPSKFEQLVKYNRMQEIVQHQNQQNESIKP